MEERGDWQRLANCVTAELEDLHWTWTDLSRKAEIGQTTMHLIRHARYHPDSDNWAILRKMESALRWERGSLERILYDRDGPLRKPDPDKAYIEQVWPDLTVAARTRLRLAAAAEVETSKMERKPRET